jgi:hypothetical protein
VKDQVTRGHVIHAGADVGHFLAARDRQDGSYLVRLAAVGRVTG